MSQTNNNAPLLESLYRGESLNRQDAKKLFSSIIQGEMNEVTMAGMLVAMKMRGETIDEISGAADAL